MTNCKQNVSSPSFSGIKGTRCGSRSVPLAWISDYSTVYDPEAFCNKRSFTSCIGKLLGQQHHQDRAQCTNIPPTSGIRLSSRRITKSSAKTMVRYSYELSSKPDGSMPSSLRPGKPVVRSVRWSCTTPARHEVTVKTRCIFQAWNAISTANSLSLVYKMKKPSNAL